jgi:hypothetical protein
VAGFQRGVFAHRSIAAAPPVPGELAIGWVFHYVVGLAYAAAYIGIWRWGLGLAPTVLSSVAFALLLLVAPWFVMQPALGLGVMAARAPNPGTIRAVNVSVHLAFGLGLYLGSLVWLAFSEWTH